MAVTKTLQGLLEKRHSPGGKTPSPSFRRATEASARHGGDRGRVEPPSSLPGRASAGWNCSTQGSGQGRGVGGVSAAITYKRVVEAARKARSTRPARVERMDVMTIMQPLRRPGQVSMELGSFPAHVGTNQRLPTHPKADRRCHSSSGLSKAWLPHDPRGPPEPATPPCPFPPARTGRGWFFCTGPAF